MNSPHLTATYIHRLNYVGRYAARLIRIVDEECDYHFLRDIIAEVSHILSGCEDELLVATEADIQVVDKTREEILEIERQLFESGPAEFSDIPELDF